MKPGSILFLCSNPRQLDRKENACQEIQLYPFYTIQEQATLLTIQSKSPETGVFNIKEIYPEIFFVSVQPKEADRNLI